MYHQPARYRRLLAAALGLWLLAGPGAAAPGAGKQRVAILPLTTPKNQPDLEQYGLGTMDTLIQALSNVPQFVMIDRARIESILKEQQFAMTGNVDQKSAVAIGKLVGAQVLVTGNLIKAGDKVRITAHFTDMKTGQIVKSEVVTGALDTIFDLMDQLASKFIQSEGVTLTQQQQQQVTAVTKATTNLNAYDYYQKGRAAYLQFTPAGYQEAIDWYRKAIELDVRYALAYAGSGTAYGLWGYARQVNGEEHQSYYDNALQFSQKAIELNPQLAEAHRALAETYLELHRWPDAQAEARKAIAINPNDAEAHYLLWRGTDSTNVDAETIHRALELNPDLVAAQVDLGYAYLQKRRYPEAVRHFQEALRVNPRSELAHNNLGLAFLNQGNLEAAGREFQAVLVLNPRFALAFNNLGQVYQRQGKVADAMAEYRKALEVNPRSVLAWRNLAALYREQKQFAPAIEAFGKALAIAPDDVDALNDAGLVYTDQGQWETAIGYFQRAAEKNPNYLYAHHNLGWSYYNLKRPAEAAEAFRRALLIDPNYVNSRNNLGLVLQQLGRAEEAEGQFRRATEIDPQYPFPYFNLGNLYEQRGEKAKAADAFETYLKLRPNYQGAAELRARILRLRGNSGT